MHGRCTRAIIYEVTVVSECRGKKSQKNSSNMKLSPILNKQRAAHKDLQSSTAWSSGKTNRRDFSLQLKVSLDKRLFSLSIYIMYSSGKQRGFFIYAKEKEPQIQASTWANINCQMIMHHHETSEWICLTAKSLQLIFPPHIHHNYQYSCLSSCGHDFGVFFFISGRAVKL